MLRDLPPLGPPDDHIFMNPPLTNNDESHPTSHEATTPLDPLDDVFGSAPSSPNLAAREDSHSRNTEVSDILRLRSIHVTNGYREGIAASKEEHIQAGFDEGFSLGGEIGMVVGWCLGVLEGVVEATAKQQDGERVKGIWEEAKDELKMEKLLGEGYFGPDGIWLYEMPGQDEEGSVTFKDVVAWHPVVRKWKGVVNGLAKEYGSALESDG